MPRESWPPIRPARQTIVRPKRPSRRERRRGGSRACCGWDRRAPTPAAVPAAGPWPGPWARPSSCLEVVPINGEVGEASGHLGRLLLGDPRRSSSGRPRRRRAAAEVSAARSSSRRGRSSAARRGRMKRRTAASLQRGLVGEHVPAHEDPPRASTSRRGTARSRSELASARARPSRGRGSGPPRGFDGLPMSCRRAARMQRLVARRELRRGVNGAQRCGPRGRRRGSCPGRCPAARRGCGRAPPGGPSPPAGAGRATAGPGRAAACAAPGRCARARRGAAAARAGRDGRPRGRLDLEVQLGREADGPQQAQGVLVEATRRVADRPDDGGARGRGARRAGRARPSGPRAMALTVKSRRARSSSRRVVKVDLVRTAMVGVAMVAPEGGHLDRVRERRRPSSLPGSGTSTVPKRSRRGCPGRAPGPAPGGRRWPRPSQRAAGRAERRATNPPTT